MNHYVTSRWPIGSLLSTCKLCTPPRTALRMFIPRRDHLMVCLLYKVWTYKPIPVAARSKAVCGRLVYGVACSNPARGMDVCFLCLYVMLSCVGRGLCDGLTTRPEESYRVSNCVCVWSRNPEKGGQWSVLYYKSLWMNEHAKKIKNKVCSELNC
jgi:hypothetical protein